MKSSMGIIGQGFLPLGKSPIFNGKKDRYENAEKSYAIYSNPRLIHTQTTWFFGNPEIL